LGVEVGLGVFVSERLYILPSLGRDCP